MSDSKKAGKQTKLPLVGGPGVEVKLAIPQTTSIEKAFTRGVDLMIRPPTGLRTVNIPIQTKNGPEVPWMKVPGGEIKISQRKGVLLYRKGPGLIVSGVTLLSVNLTVFETKRGGPICVPAEWVEPPEGADPAEPLDFPVVLQKRYRVFKLMVFLYTEYGRQIQKGADPRDPVEFRKTKGLESIGKTYRNTGDYQELYNLLSELQAYSMFRFHPNGKYVEGGILNSWETDTANPRSPVLAYFDPAMGEVLQDIYALMPDGEGALQGLTYGAGGTMQMPLVLQTEQAGNRAFFRGEVLAIALHLWGLGIKPKAKRVTTTITGALLLDLTGRKGKNLYRDQRRALKDLEQGSKYAVWSRPTPTIKALGNMSGADFKLCNIRISFNPDAGEADLEIRDAMRKQGHLFAESL